MPKELILRGVPHSIARDGWWLASEPHGAGGNPPSIPSSWVGEAMGWRMPGAAGLMILIGLGDVLFWGYPPGVSLVIFVWAVFGVAVAARSAKEGVYAPMALLFVLSLPMFEYVQPLSLGFLAVGLLIAVAWLGVPRGADLYWLGAASIRLLQSLPFSGIKSLTDSARGLRERAASGRLIPWLSTASVLSNWAFPVGGGMVLAALLVGANPVLERALLQVFQFDIELLSVLRRIVFWLGLGLLVWPFLIASTPTVRTRVPLPKRIPTLGLNAGSVLRAMILFNLFLAVQSVVDVSILLGGANLPDGMSYATYAHRGAYPLLVTAMLAGAFAVAAQPFLGQHRALKPLLLLWLLQNVLLTVSALLRLDLYVDAFGLTYLRLHALIWLGLVALGLMMQGWQVLRGHSSMWLLLRATILGLGTLYACAFINFTALIAGDVLDRAVDPAKSIGPDWGYLCDLGPTASKVIAQRKNEYLMQMAPSRYHACLNPKTTVRNWREWDFRTGRINGYLAKELDSRTLGYENSVGG
ncbi:DUF4153 domain-containing protein [Aliiroseovarius sp. 2305UL8-7]|uniref:DUF4153 domain-containing protein n=1 Tax=Aliiroseovarius conchicola TaxID=3121637 RepID=UPI003526D20F